MSELCVIEGSKDSTIAAEIGEYRVNSSKMQAILIYVLSTNTAAFGVFYVFGNLTLIASLVLLTKPSYHLKRIKDKKVLLISFLSYWFGFVLIFIFAFIVKNRILVGIFLLIQVVIAIFYILNFIPFASASMTSLVQ
ncbi:hypothetical protein GJ496_010641 [Pomphorhynchus laevis]|nr:hypothetical protein GJ496_010641 [Pomphorhynchus laevis]